MPERQQTEGDFGYRPVKPQQQITDTYSQPTLPKPDLSVLEGIGQLSKTAFEVMDFQVKQEKFQRKAGEELGKSQPDFKIGKGTTEAAMIGFQEGRGSALGSQFQNDVEASWKVRVEDNPNLLGDETTYQIFHDGYMNEFINHHQIEGLAMPKFLEGQDAYRTKKSADHAVASLKYKRKVFLEDSKQVVGTNILSMSNFGNQVNKLSAEELFDLTADFITGDETGLEQKSTLDEAREAGALPELTKIEQLAHTPQSKYSYADILKRRDKLKMDFVQEKIAPIQAMLERANESGMATLQEVEGYIIEDFMNELKSGENPDLAKAALLSLTTGTASFANRPAVRAAWLENQEEIELNIFNRAVDEEMRMDWFSATEIVQPQWSDKKWNEIYDDFESVPVESERIALRQKLLTNWDRSKKARASLTDDNGRAKSMARKMMVAEGNQYTFEDIVAASGLPAAELHRLTEAQVLGAQNINDKKIVSIENGGGGLDTPEAAQSLMEFIGNKSHTQGAKFNRIEALMDIGANSIRTTKPNMTEVRRGFELYRAMKNVGVEGYFTLKAETKEVFEDLITAVQDNKDKGFSQLVNEFYYTGVGEVAKVTGLDTDDIIDEFQEFDDGRGILVWSWLNDNDIAPTKRTLQLFGDMMQAEMDRGATKSAAADIVRARWEANGISVVGDNESERLFQAHGDFSRDTWEELDDYVNDTMFELQEQSDSDLDDFRTQAREAANKKTKIGQTKNLKGETVDVFQTPKEEWESRYMEQFDIRMGQSGGVFGAQGDNMTREMSSSERLQMNQAWEKKIEQDARELYRESKVDGNNPEGYYPLDSQNLMFDDNSYHANTVLETVGGWIEDAVTPEDNLIGIATRINLDGQPTYYLAQWTKHVDGEWYPVPLPDRVLEMTGFGKYADDGTTVYRNHFTSSELLNSSWGSSFNHAKIEANRRARQRGIGAREESDGSFPETYFADPLRITMN